MMIDISDKSKCCGCGSCVLVCPKKCIHMEEDKVGFLFPQVEASACIHCGRCTEICPLHNVPKSEQIKKEVFAALARKFEDRFNGSSGGVFGTIAQWVISQKGVVFGAGFDENLKLKCMVAKSEKELPRLYKSKYLQSEIGDQFAEVKGYLTKGHKVLFCSTPCQVVALKKYLGLESNNPNLIMVDFFCHGVPSQSFFDKCIKYVETKKRIKIHEYEFRTKVKNGTTPHYYTYKYTTKRGKAKKKTKLYLFDPFYMGFQKYINLRDSCYNCPYGRGNHCGDMTIGDFHDVDKYVRGINRFDGISTVIINSDKGKDVWNSINNELKVYPLEMSVLLKDQAIFSGATPKPEKRDEFMHDLQNREFKDVASKWLNSRKEWKKIIYYHLPKPIRMILKRML